MSVRLSGLARREYWLFAVLLTCTAFVWYGDAFAMRLSQPSYLVGVFTWLFVAILGSALSVVRHAEQLAVRLGEPYGTLILTLSVTVIEVASITAIMLHGENNPTLTRETLFAVVMIILNGMVGLSLLVGGLRHREQHYNLQGANAYLGVILPLIAFSLLLPDFTQTTPGPTLSIGQSAFIAIAAVGLYATFLALQTGPHRNYFKYGDGDLLEELEEGARANILPHVLLLVAYMVPVVYLAEQLAVPVDYVIETMGAPAAVGGVAIAILVATPEAIGAVRAALANRVQRSINIFLGSVLSTICLTIAAVQVGRVLVDMLGSDGRLDPSHATIAVKARVHIDTVRRALNQLQVAGFVSWVRRLIRTRWRCEQTSSAYTLAVPTATALFKAFFLKETYELTSRAKYVSQEKAPSAIDVTAAREALEDRQRVVEQRLLTRRSQCSGLRRCASISSISFS